MPYLDEKHCSPDPTFGQKLTPIGDKEYGLDLFPLALCTHTPAQDSLERWAAGLDLHTCSGPVRLQADDQGQVSLLFDFGTEIHGALEIQVDSKALCNLMVTFGESMAEAEGLVPGISPSPICMWPIPGSGACVRQFASAQWHAGYTPKDNGKRAFRFVRLQFADVDGEIVLDRFVAHAVFTFAAYQGSLQCADLRLQRAWQTSAYTVRLCTRPDSLWDGIKRDRSGWYGDGRVIKESADLLFADPEPTEKMLAVFPTDSWPQGVPAFSFDAIDMLSQHILYYGMDRAGVWEAYNKIKLFLDWVQNTQCNTDGLLVRRDDQYYFGDIGFLDWSYMPVGGRFEELSWLQLKYVEGLRIAACVARWLADPARAAEWQARADHLQKIIKNCFWRNGQGYVHTLNQVGAVANPLLPGYGGHYQKTYVEKIALGPSGPTRQANVIAILAGCCDDGEKETILKHVLNNDAVEPIITAYFTYFEQRARVLCGDGAGAVRRMAGYIEAMLEREDAAAIWELYDPRVSDLRKYYGHFELGFAWPLSLCHGFGSGLIPLVSRCLAGIEIRKPGFAEIAINPVLDYRTDFELTIPTPHGSIRVQRDADNHCQYEVPAGIQVSVESPHDAIKLIQKS